jgi:hypothetical protein
VAVVALAAMPVVACGGPKGVGVEKGDTNLAFSVHTPQPAQTQQPQAAPEAPLLPSIDLFPAQLDLPQLPRPVLPIGFAPAISCPTAATGAAPARVAGLTVEGTPVEGMYRWKQSGTSTISVLGIPFTTAVTGFHSQTVFGVTPVTAAPLSDPIGATTGGTDHSFTFQTQTQHPGTSSLVKETWQVRPKPGFGDPQGGLTLLERDAVNQDGTTTTLFKPAGSGLLHLPLPITPGATWTSTAADPSNGVTEKLSGQVLGRDVVDACGTLVEGWKVHADLVIASAANTAAASTQVQESEDYMVAPQLGCVIIAEKIDTDVVPGDHVKADYTLGSAQPIAPAVASK